MSELPRQSHNNFNNFDSIVHSSPHRCLDFDTPKVLKNSLQYYTEYESANQTQSPQKLNDQLLTWRHERHQNYINNKRKQQKKDNSCLLPQEFT